MANLERIVNVQILLRTAGVTQRSFSDLLIVGAHSDTNRVNVITSADDLLDPSYALSEVSQLYLAARTVFSQTPSINRLFVGKRISGETVAVNMAAIRAANDGWYGFAEPARTATDIDDYAAWGEANQKLFLTGLLSAQTTGTGDTNIALTLKTNNYFRTAWWLVPDIASFPDLAAASRSFSVLPGGETWANIRLAGVASPLISETVYTSITALNGNTFEPFRNVSITQNGKTAGGEWIDIIRFRDWLCEEIRTGVFNQLVDNRIPYTDVGIGIIRQRVQEALDRGVRRGGIAPPEPDEDGKRLVPSYTISVPLSTSISVSDKAARVLRDVSFTARLAGAIHAAEIRGTLTYDNIG